MEENVRETPKVVAVIPAAGIGARMGSDRPKQYLTLDGKPILAVTVERFQSATAVDGIIVVVPEPEIDFSRKEIVERYGLHKVRAVVPGGPRRQDSVRLGIEATGGGYGLVLVHDGVRPFVDDAVIENVLRAALSHGAAVAGLKATETLKEADETGFVLRTRDRNRIWMIQTPQAFRYEDIRMAHERAWREGWDGITDDAVLMERLGIPVKVVPGSQRNIKVTTPHDLELARFLASSGGNEPA
jgi:2-C-methyl-D-erythritol 4-phosphate cytidylyltransferase